MKSTLFSCLAFCILHSAFCIPASAQPLDSAYHDNAEILAELQHYAETYPDWMTLDTIGHGAQYGLPIWCAKISDNPQNTEPEAAILLIGQVHAEEVVGIELVLEVMRQMLDHNEENAFRQRLEGLEIYIIPTANPEGHEVVTSGRDVTFRKNCRDNVGDGVLRISDREGWDTSGIDLNRNFGTHWDRGDTLYRPEASFRYNGYRGAAPFSESESQALRELGLSRQFLYSVVYHSSRSGTNNELVIAPWYWTENDIVKRPPDFAAMDTFAYKLSTMIPTQDDPETHYRYGMSMQRKGQLQDWFYAETGCIQVMNEVAADIHPDSSIMGQIVADNLPAVWYMMDLALGLAGLDGFGTLTVIATDSANGRPIQAIVEVNDMIHPILAPRHTNPLTGRYDWLLPAGAHDIAVWQDGYEAQLFENIEIPNGERRVLEVTLNALRRRECFINARFTEVGDPESAWMELYTQAGKCLSRVTLTITPSLFELYPSKFYLEVTSEGYLPMVVPFEVTADSGGSFTIMKPAHVIYEESFSADRAWNHNGNGWGIKTFDGRSCLTESVIGDYPNDADLWLELNDVVQLDTARATLRIIHLPYCEPVDDYQEIEFWTNRDEIHSKRYSQLRAYRRLAAGDGSEIPDWDTLYIPLDSLEAGMLNVRFHVATDAAIAEDGWLIDQVAVFVENHDNAVKEPSFHLSTFNFQLHPNPFNSSTTITVSLSAQSAVNLRVYSLDGRLVSELVNGRIEAGERKVVWDASGLAAGVYVIRLENGSSALCRKLVLVH